MLTKGFGMGVKRGCDCWKHWFIFFLAVCVGIKLFHGDVDKVS